MRAAPLKPWAQWLKTPTCGPQARERPGQGVEEGLDGTGKEVQGQPWAQTGTEQEHTRPLGSLDTDTLRHGSNGWTGPGPELHDTASSLVRMWVFEPQSLLRPVLLQVGELLAVDGSTALPADRDGGSVSLAWTPCFPSGNFRPCGTLGELEWIDPQEVG